MKRQTLLRFALLGNAVFSTICALGLILYPDIIGDLIGWSATLIYQAVGACLIIFAADLYHQVSQKHLSSLRALIACLADFSWVIATVIVLLAFSSEIAENGKLLLLGIASMVMLFGILQALGINKLFTNSESPNRLSVCIKVISDTPTSAIWPIIADLGNIQRYANNLKNSEVHLPPNKQLTGSVRTCTDTKGNSWQEKCVHSVEGKSLSIEFLTDANDFPFPMIEMLGKWQLVKPENAPSTSVVQVSWEFVLRNPSLSFILLPMMTWQIERDFPLLIGKMAEDAKRLSKGQPLTESALTPTKTPSFSFC